ncbi:MAG: hypothetical protein QXO71_07130 [Candidatus Jordarchaeaceae archaeon]
MEQKFKVDVTKEVTVTVFPPLSGCGPSSSCCGPSMCCGPSVNPFSGKDLMDELSQRLEEIKENFGNTVQIETVEYGTVSQLRHAIDRLNLVLKASGNDFVVSTKNFFIFISSAAPIIAVNNKIISAGSVPTREQMFNRIKAAFSPAQQPHDLGSALLDNEEET